MKKLLNTIFWILIFIVGLSLILYPTISNKLAIKAQSQVINNYNQALSNTLDEELSKARKLAIDYNKSLLGSSTFINTFKESSEEFSYEEYENILNLDNGVMGYLFIPNIDVNLPIYHGTSEISLSNGAGHLFKTSLPVGGKGTHTVISSHTGLPSAKLFDNIDKLEMGDVFYLNVLDKTLAYQIDQIKTVEPTDVDDLAIEKDMDYATLLTCTPYGINSHRLLVRGHRIPYTETEENSDDKTIVEKAKIIEDWLKTNYTALIILLAFIILTILIYNVKKHKKRKTIDKILHKKY